MTFSAIFGIRIHVNLNKSSVDLASRVTIFNTVVRVLNN